MHSRPVIVYNGRYPGTATKVARRIGGVMIDYERLTHGLVPQGAFHFAYPRYANVLPDSALARLQRFFVLPKHEQRLVLARFFPTPKLSPGYSGKVVARLSANHSHGSGFKVFPSIDDVPGDAAYVAPLITRVSETRLIVVRGKPVFAYRRVGERQDTPWSIREPGVTVDVIDPVEAVDDHPGLGEAMARFCQTLCPDVMGVDIAKTVDGSYVVFEINLAPGSRVSGVSAAIATAAMEVI